MDCWCNFFNIASQYKDITLAEITDSEFENQISGFSQSQQNDIRKAREKFFLFQQMRNNNTWILEKELKAATLSSCVDTNTGLKVIFRKITFNVPIAKAVNFFKDENQFSKLNENLKEARIVEDVGFDTFYVYHCFKGNLIISDRDFTLLKHWFTLPDGRFAMLSFSVTHPKMPEVKGRVRAYTDLSAYVLTPISENEWLCESIQNGDPKGNLPSMLVNTRATKQLDSLIKCKALLEKK